MTCGTLPQLCAALALVISLLASSTGAQTTALTAEERAYLAEHGPIRYAPDPSFAPFESIDAEGRAVGITPDLLALIGRRLGIEFRSVRYPTWSAVLAAARRGEVDLLGTLTRTPEREAFLRFSRPYLSVPYVLFTRDDRRDITSLAGLGSARLGVVENYGINHWLSTRHPELRPVAAADARAGLSMLSTGRLDAFLETLPVGLYVLREESFSNIRMVPGEVYALPQHLAVPAGQDRLLAIIEKGLRSLTPAEHTAVFVRWTGHDFSRPTPALSPVARNALAALLALVTLALGWVVSLRRGIRRQTRALQESEARFRHLIEKSPVAMAVNDGNERIEYVNDKFHATIGYTLEDIPTVARWLSLAYPDEAYREAVTREWYQRVEQARACGGGIAPLEGRVTCKDGKVRVFEISGAPVGDKQLVVFGDVTEGRRVEDALRAGEARYRSLYRRAVEQEELYKSLLQSIPDPVALYTVAGAATYINPSFTRVFGFTLDEVKGRKVPFVPEGEAERTAAEIRGVLAGRPCTGFETRRLTRDGRVLDITLSSAVYHDHEGRVAGIVVVLRDVTERRRAEDEKGALEEQLRHAQKMEAIGTLAGGVAHDFNNILSAIVGYADLTLLRLSAEGPERGYLGEILKAAYRARDLVQQILALSRRAPQERRPVELASIVGEALRLLRATLPSTIEIREHIDPEPGSVLADATHLHQILVNLGTNARYAMRETGGVLEVGLERVAVDGRGDGAPAGLAAGRYARLTVRDTGPGMGAAVRQRIFEPYFTTKPVGEGSGLGLAVVHGIVTALGGAIAVDSEPGRGSTFEVFLPLLAESSAPTVPDALPVPTGRERVLVVDDEPAVSDATRKMLEALGYRVTATTDSTDALALVRADPAAFDLVLTDQTLPHLTGLELLGELLALRPDLPVVLCTGYSDVVDEGKAKRLGAKGFVLKPLNLRNLAEAARQALDASSDSVPLGRVGAG